MLNLLRKEERVPNGGTFDLRSAWDPIKIDDQCHEKIEKSRCWTAFINDPLTLS